MNAQRLDLFPATSVGLSELSIASAISVTELLDLIDYGALEPLQPVQIEPQFSISCIEPLRTAGKVRSDFDLDLFVVVILMEYLKRILQLESQLCHLQAQSVLPN